MAVLQASVRGSNEIALGSWGHKEISSGSNATPPTGYYYHGLMVDTDAVFTADSVITGSDDISSETRYAGRIILGLFDDVTVASGTVIGYLIPTGYLL